MTIIGYGFQCYAFDYFKTGKQYWDLENAIFATVHRFIYVVSYAFGAIVYITSGLGKLSENKSVKFHQMYYNELYFYVITLRYKYNKIYQMYILLARHNIVTSRVWSLQNILVITLQSLGHFNTSSMYISYSWNFISRWPIWKNRKYKRKIKRKF